MLAIILVIAGAFSGFITLLFTGVPLVLLSVFRILPFDRRVWWCLATVLAYFIVKDMVLSGYDYKIPTARPDNFYFDAHVLGACIGVVATFLLGLTILFFVGKPTEERKRHSALMIPVTALVVAGGVGLVISLAQPTEVKRAKLEAAQQKLIAAIKSGDVASLRDCIASGTRTRGNVPELGNKSMMDYAIEQQQIEVVRLLLDPPSGPKEDVNARWLRKVLETGNEQLIDVFLESPNGDKYVGRILRAAIANDDTVFFRKAMSLGADPNACESYDTPLTLCAKHNRIGFATQLLAKGANPNQYHGSPDLNRGTTPLVTAADRGHLDMVKLLLKHGAKVNRTQKNHRSALQGACRGGHLEVAQVLIDAGADVGHQTYTKATALHLAIEPDSWNKNVTESTKVSIVKLLLDAGIDVTVKYRYGTAREVAERHDLQEVVQILRQRS